MVSGKCPQRFCSMSHDQRIESENGLLNFFIYDKRDDFNFEIVYFPFMDSCIPKKSALGFYQ